METIVSVLVVIAGVALYHFLEHLYYTLDARIEQKKMQKQVDEFNAYLASLGQITKRKPVRKTR